MPSALISLRSFVHEHDDLPAFHASYLVLTVIVAGMLNLGAFAVLIAIHMALDVIKYRDYHRFTWAQTADGVVRESLFDITLLMIGLVFSVYLHHAVGMAGLSGLIRAEASVFRAAAILIPKVKILHAFLRIVSHMHHYLDHAHIRCGLAWNRLEKLCIASVVVSCFLLAWSPAISGADGDLIVNILMVQLIPWSF